VVLAETQYAAQIMLIRFPNKDLDLGFVFKFYEEAPDYLESAEGQKPKLEKIISFFIDTPPNCDPNRSFRLELFWAAVCQD